MKSCRILLFILGQITKSVTIVKIQSVQTAFLAKLISSRWQSVLSRSKGFPLKRLYLNPLIFDEPSLDSFIGVFLSEIFQAYRFVVAFEDYRPILSAFAHLQLAPHFFESVFHRRKIGRVGDCFVDCFSRHCVAGRHTGFLFFVVIGRLFAAVRFWIIIQSVLLTDTVGNEPELEPRFFFSP